MDSFTCINYEEETSEILLCFIRQLYIVQKTLRVLICKVPI